MEDIFQVVDLKARKMFIITITVILSAAIDIAQTRVNSAFEKELVKYDYHESINTLLKEIILSNFKYIQENIDGKKKELSEQIVSLTNRLSLFRKVS
ncbi:hypothetical protein [Chryseobacterium indoltheticum]|uniref:hypothetical protein n=1 Tax=Chryseobacterium indoltheticum TaxID=254 RepID=UPI003F491570